MPRANSEPLDWTPRTYLGFGATHGGRRCHISPWWGKQRRQRGIHASDSTKVFIDYRPSLHALKFHQSEARLRFLSWGVRSGKSQAGAAELLRCGFAEPNGVSWVVSPTYNTVKVTEMFVLQYLRDLDRRVLKRVNRHEHEMELWNGHIFQFKSADWPDNLRGPTVSGLLWLDEAAFIKPDAWYICRQRVATNQAPIIFTTTPNGRNWLYEEIIKCGLPTEDKHESFKDYRKRRDKYLEEIKGDKTKKASEIPDLETSRFGEYEKKGRWVSHRPTWHFPWVPMDELADMKDSTVKPVWDRENGALFTSAMNQVFKGLHRVNTWRAPFKHLKKQRNMIGVDLARSQDYTAIVVMAGTGNILHLDMWSDTEWQIQRDRIQDLTKEWNAIIVLDRANVGSVIEEDLIRMDMMVHAVDMNAPTVKNELIQALQMSVEHSKIHIPHVKCEWAAPHTQDLWNQLNAYEIKITPGGRVSYGAPRGMYDDLVIALALANWGRVRGFGGNSRIVSVILDKDDDNEPGSKIRRHQPPGWNGNQVAALEDRGFGARVGKYNPTWW